MSSVLKHKLALITGASSGIGRACAVKLAESGCNLLLCARRLEKLQELKSEIISQFSNCKIHIFQLDVQNFEAVQTAIEQLPEDFKNINILINNAGLSRGLNKIQAGNISDWNEMIDTNIKGLLYITKAVIPLMQGTGQIVNIGSIAGHEVYPGGNVYCATKHAVAAITKGMRIDLLETNIKVTTVDPGMVETEFSKVRFHGDDQRASEVYKGVTPLTANDIADTIKWVVDRPDHVQIAEIIILAAQQASATLVNRR